MGTFSMNWFGANKLGYTCFVLGIGGIVYVAAKKEEEEKREELVRVANREQNQLPKNFRQKEEEEVELKAVASATFEMKLESFFKQLPLLLLLSEQKQPSHMGQIQNTTSCICVGCIMGSAESFNTLTSLSRHVREWPP